ncbi:hypothetical protein Pfo_010510 [Paulownia fortunei]|nr:hypothetical protein Pfo_010510 [Paulownia fortunei]
MAEAAERYSNSDSTNIKLLIISADCDPKAELPFSGLQPAKWDAIVDALIKAKYCFAMRRLPPPPNISISNNPKNISFRIRVAFLSLQASKKVAFFYGDVKANYEITYDENLMNDLPSYCNLKGLPRFHLFMSLPEDLQRSIVELLDGVGFARMRFVCRQFSRLRWNRSFNILKYSHPDVNKQRAVQGEELNKDKNGGGGSCFVDNGFFRFASAVCFVAVVYCIVNEVRPGVCVYDYEDE